MFGATLREFEFVARLRARVLRLTPKGELTSVLGANYRLFLVLLVLSNSGSRVLVPEGEDWEAGQIPRRRATVSE